MAKSVESTLFSDAWRYIVGKEKEREGGGKPMRIRHVVEFDWVVGELRLGQVTARNSTITQLKSFPFYIYL